MRPPTPVLVYNRIDKSRRNARLLIAIFVVVLVPFAAYWIQYLMEVVLILVSGLPSLELPRAFVVAGVLALGLSMGVVWLEYLLAARKLLSHAGAEPVASGTEQELVRQVENLCIGSGLPVPEVHIVETPSVNALSTGMRPSHSHLVVTRGLLKALDRNELEAVIAHELAHIGNGDTGLATMRAAFVATTWLPLRLVVGFLRLGFRVHWGVGALLLLWIGSGVVSMLSFGLEIAHREPTLRPFFLLAFGVTFYSFLAAPVLASLVARLLTGERDFLADGEAMLLTRNAGALARALTASMDPSVPKVAAGPATAHLWFAPPIPRGGDWWRAFSGASSAAERVERIRQWGPADVPRS